jgi:hypothetical protein
MRSNRVVSKIDPGPKNPADDNVRLAWMQDGSLRHRHSTQTGQRRASCDSNWAEKVLEK